MITIFSKPYTSFPMGNAAPLNVNPVYNGLPFVVDSNLTSASNFKYIAEIYFNGQKVTELRHHPDVSNSNKGVFDIGRIVENFMSFDINVLNVQNTNTIASFPALNTVNSYYVNFGEELSRVLTFKAISTGSGGVMLNANEPNIMTATNGSNYNDYVYIQGSTIPSYNGWKRLRYRSGTYNFVIDTPNAGTPDFSQMYAIQGQKILRFTSTMLNGIARVKILIKNQGEQNRLQKGDRVMFDSTVTGLNQFYRLSEWNVISDPIAENNLMYGPCWTLVLDTPYKFTIPSTLQGAIISKDNFVLKNKVSTAIDKSYAWTGVRQYEEEWLDLNGNKSDVAWPKKYQREWTNIQESFKAFSDKPSKTATVCMNEVYQLCTMGSWMNKTNTNVARSETHIRLETWSSDTSATSAGSIISQAGTLAYQSLTYQVSSLAGTTFGVGDYVTLSKSGNTRSGRIVRISGSGGSSFIHTDIAYYSPLIGAGSIASTIKVRYRDCVLQATAQNFPCGPANLIQYSEFQNNICYKYFVYPIYPQSGAYYSATGGLNPSFDDSGTNYPGNRFTVGEKWEFTIDQSCCSDMPTYKIMWLNKQGGFDFYKFNKRSDKRLTITREGFQRKLPNVQPSNIYGYKSGQRGTTTYNTTSIETIIMNSDFLTQSDLDWLVNIYESPEVYIVEDKTSKPFLIPVTVVAEEVIHPSKKFKDENKGSLYQYQLVVEKANGRVIQRGGSSGGALNSNSGAPTPIINPRDIWTARDAYQQATTTWTKSLYE